MSSDRLSEEENSVDLSWIKPFSAGNQSFDIELQSFKVEADFCEVWDLISGKEQPRDKPDKSHSNYALKREIFDKQRKRIKLATVVVLRSLQKHHQAILSQVMSVESHLKPVRAFKLLMNAMSRGGNSLSKAALETKWERLKMKRQGNLLFNFRKVVTDICLTANALASINALDPMLNCAKSEDDKMLKLAGAVVKKLGGAALTYQVTNSDQSFDGLKECLERNIEMMTRKKTHAESSDSGSESEEEQGLAAVAESSDDSSDDDDSDDSESDGGVNKHQVHMIGQRKRPRNGTDVEEEQRQVERHPQRDDQSGDRGAGGEQQEESGDCDENEYCGDDCEDPFCGEDEFGTFDCNGEYYYFDEWDEIHYYDEHGEYFYDEYGECHYIDANEYGEEVQYGEEQGQYDYQQQQQSQYIDDNRNQGSWHQAAHKKYCYGCGSESHTVPHCPDRYRGPPLKSVSSNDEQVSSKRNRNNFVGIVSDVKRAKW